MDYVYFVLNCLLFAISYRFVCFIIVTFENINHNLH